MKTLRSIAAVMAAAVILTGGSLSAAAEAPVPEERAELILRAVCRCGGETPEDGSLTFALWDGQFNILQMVVNLRQHAAFAPLYFHTPGRYIYYISQEGGRDLSVAYDPAMYQVVVEVRQGQEGLNAHVAEVNRVRGDCVGEAEILEGLGPDGTALFENRVREIPLLAEVPDTGDSTGLWLSVWLLSGVTLFFAGVMRRRCGNQGKAG